jgi:hypothetical protein
MTSLTQEGVGNVWRVNKTKHMCRRRPLGLGVVQTGGLIRHRGYILVDGSDIGAVRGAGEVMEEHWQRA